MLDVWERMKRIRRMRRIVRITNNFIILGMQRDISTRADIELLVNTFYERVRKDGLIGPVFEEKIGAHWEEHLQKMYNFWENILLGNNVYQGRPFPPHARLPIGQEHFNAWLGLFHHTVDELFSGPLADEAKKRSVMIAGVFQSKLSFLHGRVNGL